MLSVEHDREFFGAGGVLACHDCARMRAVGNSARMQGDRRRFDSFPGTKIAADVKQNLVGFDVVVDPRNFDRFRMIIE